VENGPIRHLSSTGPSCVLRRLASGLWLVLAACGGAPAVGTGPILLVDDAGDTVRLARPAERIVSLVPATTEALFALGAGSSVVGRTTWCDSPVEALAVPSVGDGLEPNLEAVVARRPDLVVLYQSVGTAEAVVRLRALGIPAVQLRTDLLRDFDRALDLLGTATGRGEPAARLRARLDSALRASDFRDPAGPRVLIVAWDQPPMTIGRGSFLHEIVERAGARNLFDDIASASAPVSLEAIAARDPDAILTTAESPGFLARPEWQVVRAVREGRVIRVAGTEFLRPGPRAAAAVAFLRSALDALGRR
jgi:iron complex transport system substrate-binding protein